MNDLQTELWGLDPETHRPTWVRAFHPDELATPRATLQRLSDTGRLPRCLGVLVAIDNGIRAGHGDLVARGDTDHGYQLAMIDLSTGRILWRLPLTVPVREPPLQAIAGRFQLATDDTGSLVIVVDTQTGALVHGSRAWSGAFAAARQATGDRLWLRGPPGDRRAYAYSLPDLTAITADAPPLTDVTAAQRLALRGTGD